MSAIRKSTAAERPYERFVREYMTVFNSGGGLKEVAKALDTTENTVGVTAAALRRNGVRLPRFTDRFDAGFLNDIITRSRKAARKGGAHVGL